MERIIELWEIAFQECFDYFYDVITKALNDYFSMKLCTISNRDPPYITAEVKSLLRTKNHLMHSGKIELASALGTKIGTLIARYNSTRLTQAPDSVNLWDEVRRLTGSTKAHIFPESLNASVLNAHYTVISSEPQYRSPCPKSGCNKHEDMVLIEEPSVFHLWDKLQRTASGPDNLPSWFLRLAAPIISEPLTFAINLSLLNSTVPH